METANLLRILILEDSITDAGLLIRSLKKELPFDFEIRHVVNREEFLLALDEYNPDIVLSDYNLVTFTGLDALVLVREKYPNLPLIIVTGTINEETAVNCLKAGASDYVLKENLARFSPAIQNTLEKSRLAQSQKTTQKALDQSENELNLIFNSSPIMMTVIDDELKIKKINRKFLEFSKTTATDIFDKKVGSPLGCSLSIKNSCSPDSDRCQSCELVQFIRCAIHQNCDSKNEEINIDVIENGIRQTITYHIYLEELTPKPSATFLITLIDITERKKTLRKLMESERKFRELADTLPEVVFEMDTSTTFSFLNNAAYRKFNIDPSLIAPNQLSVLQFVHPDDVEKLAQNLSAGLADQSVSGHDYKILLPDNNIGYFQIFNTVVITDGLVTGFRGIAIDITERKKMEVELLKHREQLETLVRERTSEFEEQARQLKESQLALSYLLEDVNESREELLASNREIEKLSQAIEQSPSSVEITDTDGNIEYVNKQFEATSGYTVNELIGKNPRLLNSGTHTKDFFASMWDKIKLGQKWSGEICNRRKNGELYWEYTSISSLRNTDNEITNFIAVKEDITGKKIIEQKLKEYTSELELFNKTMVDRELKIIEMKEEVNALHQQLGLEIKYPPVWDNSSQLPS